MTRSFKLALRSLMHSPALAATVVATLAIGIGANTAIFSLVYGMLLRPFPYAEPDQLVKLHMYPVKNPANEYSVSLADVEDIEKRVRSAHSFAISGTAREPRERRIIYARFADTGHARCVPGPGRFADARAKLHSR
jgi:hypothetical protein